MSDYGSDNDEVDALVAFGQALVEAILEHQPLALVRKMVEDGAPLWFQDHEGTSALHAAAYTENEELIQYLIEQGAVWNAVDNLHNTAGDIVLSMNNETCYNIIRDAGIRSELLLTLLASRTPPATSPLSMVLQATDTTAAGSQNAFLSSKLKFVKDDNGQEILGVMMGWERGIMQETGGLKVLNVGFGLGSPLTHCVKVDATPDVLAHMRDLGWYDKPNVRILEGKWQDFVESEELLGVGGFDVVYTDTFSEDYKARPRPLAGPESRFGFFNGLGATNALFYDVYTRVSELHLADVGIDIEWTDVDVFEGGQDRWGETREYFAQRFYRLPVGRMRAIS
ncbi:uncharacterized protein B0H18DRAFT_975822 [Fomitopsis serialis]|uniref:uncharacterized protein n=1 Tax=Fomitopsis serialis TaxID=139415 RepID=UPI0020081CD9|nr:uncharacterized protein B0H18DRAFT_975822 [Neoantrodia serialis]KAH9935476.1 hypothetical protein B0H18DRAFT_975822 [Neoantrodia serialis]